MNVKQAKNISLVGILQQLGCDTPEVRGGELWYFSPFRKEGDRSFQVHPQKNIWMDFGIGQGGTTIDFAMHYFGVCSVSEALRALEAFRGVGSSIEPAMPLFGQDKPHYESVSGQREVTESAITIRKVQPLQNRALIQYLEKRAIPLGFARPYVQEAYYTVRGRDRTYFALAFPNQSGGYELRNPAFKAVAGHKDISLIMPEIDDFFSVMVFEGFMDFVSYLVYHKTPAPTVSAIILNSVAMKGKAIAAIQERGFVEVELYLDRDDSGRWLTQELLAVKNLAVNGMSGVYDSHKDFNELIRQQSLTHSV